MQFFYLAKLKKCSETRTNSYKKITSVKDTLNSFFGGTNLAHFFSATNTFSFFCFYPITTFIIRYSIFSFLCFYSFAINLAPLCAFHRTHTTSHIFNLTILHVFRNFYQLFPYNCCIVTPALILIRDGTQHVDVNEANFHPVLFLVLLYFMSMNLQT